MGQAVVKSNKINTISFFNDSDRLQNTNLNAEANNRTYSKVTPRKRAIETNTNNQIVVSKIIPQLYLLKNLYRMKFNLLRFV